MCVDPLTISPQPSIDGHDTECGLQYAISGELPVKMSESLHVLLQFIYNHEISWYSTK